MYVSALGACSLSSNNTNMGHCLLKAFHVLGTVLSALDNLILVSYNLSYS